MKWGVGIVAAFLLIWIIAVHGGSGASPTAPSSAPSATSDSAPDSDFSTAPQPVAPPPPAPAQQITTDEWQLIAKDPDGHAGERIIIYGVVTQFDAATGPSNFRALVDAVSYPTADAWIQYATNTFLTGDAFVLTNVVQGDEFTAEATVNGPYTYQNQMGGSTTAPRLTVTKLTVIGKD